MAIPESIKIVASMWIFVRAFVKAVIIYVNEAKAPKQKDLQGRGLDGPSLPKTLPTAVDIKKTLPKRCFQPTVMESGYYALKDVVQVAVCWWVFATFHGLVPQSYWITMPFYWALQGTFFTAIFVIGHDCGHGSFSNHTLLNDIVGQVMHGFLFCPYYMWKLSHRHHHRFNANFDRDEVFYPVKESSPAAGKKVLPGFGFGLGWFVYLLVGYQPRPVQHFTPYDDMFTGYRLGCWITLAVLGLMGYLLAGFANAYGILALVNYYVVPLAIFGSYMVVITFLHHTEMNTPWYNDANWDFVRGQLSTVDRHYGHVHDVIHNIGTHQIHHLFSRVPHYHLEEATVAFRKAFPELVRVCDEPILPSFLRMFRKYEHQSIMDDATEVHVYKDRR